MRRARIRASQRAAIACAAHDAALCDIAECGEGEHVIGGMETDVRSDIALRGRQVGAAPSLSDYEDFT